jgi:hypothetical protein
MVDIDTWKINKLEEMNKFQNLIAVLDFGRIEKLGNTVVETLKKDNRNKLWDKPMPNFTFRDYEVLKKL